METQEIYGKVQSIFRDIFDDESLVISSSTNSKDIPDWDSLNHINLVSAIEKEFKIKFALGELRSLQDVGGMIELMKKKIDKN